MTLDGALLLLQQVQLLAFVPVAWLLGREAWKKPHEWALTLFFLLTLGIAAVGVIYQLAILNAALGYVVDQLVGRVGLRAAMFLLGLVPFVFLWVYKTGRFGQDGKP